MKFAIVWCHCCFDKSLLYINKIKIKLECFWMEWVELLWIMELLWSTLRSIDFLFRMIQIFFDACFQCIHEILSVTTYRQKYFVHDILQPSCDTCLCTCIEQYTKKSCLEKNDPCFDLNWDGISFLSYFCFSCKAKMLSNIININNELNCLNSNFLISKKPNYIYILCYYLVVFSFLKTSLLIHML